jgi:hypothetical protein
MGYIVEPGNTPSRFTGQAASVAKMNNNKFAVIYGNGANSNNGSAALYILFVDGPASGVWTAGGTSPSYVKIVADTGPGNGLSQPTWVDTNADGLADAIYAGDLKGNLWKFDVSGATPASWGVAFHGRPLFKARAVDGSASSYQPISAAPEFSFHPKGGVLVSFATGKALSSSDFPDTSGRPHSRLRYLGQDRVRHHGHCGTGRCGDRFAQAKNATGRADPDPPNQRGRVCRGYCHQLGFKDGVVCQFAGHVRNGGQQPAGDQSQTPVGGIDCTAFRGHQLQQCTRRLHHFC